MGEKIVIVGGGIAGLFASLALSGAGREVVVLDRDPPPPDASPDAAFDVWQRQGVGHLRHSHAFLAKLYRLIRDNYPDLLDELLAAGCRELTFGDGLPATLRDGYVPAEEDASLTILTSRRTTLEYVIRNYAARRPGVRFITEVIVRGLMTERTGSEQVRVRGVKAEIGGALQELTADLVIDAGGRTSDLIDWLQAEGLPVREESENAGILYFTRHYRLHDGRQEPERGTVPGAGDLGYIKYGVFPGDNRCFSITLAVPEIEHEMRKAIMRPETFDGICARLPGIAQWTSTETAEPRSRVFAMGGLKSRWRQMVKDGEPLALGFFPVGDSVIRTNPLYGRGCSFAAIEAHILRDVLDLEADPAARARRFHARVWDEVRPFYDDMVKQDLTAIKRARNELNPDYRPGFKARLAKSFVDDGLIIALRGNVELMRAAMRGFHMLEPPTLWLKDARNFLAVMRVWLRGKRRNAALYPPKLGPARAEMMTALGLSPDADIERLKAA